MLGKVNIKRLRYCCENDNCDYTEYPLDEILGIGRGAVSKGMAKSLSLISIFVPFTHAKKFIGDLLGISISQTCIKDTSLKIGNKIYEANKMEAEQESVSQEVAESPEVLYIQSDGAMVPIAGENKIEFKENKLGIVFSNKDLETKTGKNGKKRTTIKNKRFVSSLGEGVSIFKKMLFQLCIKRGLLKAKTVVFLSDGAIWLRNFKNDYIKNAIQILDWYHAVEHLWTTAHKLFGEQNKKRCETWVKELKDMLWDGKVQEVLESIESQALKRKRNQTPLWELYNYYLSNKNAMQYNEFRKQGFYIGSGAIESANKYIVANRLKLAGMRWSKKNANAMISLRCKFFENIWDEFWENLKLPDFLNRNLAPNYG